MFRVSGSFGVGSNPTAVLAADFDGDGDLDLAAVNSAAGAANGLSVLLGDGSGGFGAATNYTTRNGPFALVTGDFNGDGNADLAVHSTSEHFVSILLGAGTGAFGATTHLPTFGGQGLAIADLDGDGDLDLAASHGFGDILNVLLGDGSGGFATSAGSPFAAGDEPTGVAAGDLDGDGDVDLVAANRIGDSVSVMLNDGAGSFASSILLTGDTPIFAALGDLNGDGDLDLVTSGVGLGNVSSVNVHLGNGDGTFGPASITPVGDGAWKLALADLDGDGNLDAAVTSLNADEVTVLTGDGSGGWASTTTFAVASARGVAVGDYNGDGRPDLAVGNQGADTVSILLNTGLAITADAPVAADEGQTGTRTFTFTVTRYGSAAGAVSADWAVTGFAANPADAADFQGGVLPSGTVNFLAGEATQTITVTVAGDVVIEPDETFLVTLSNPVGIAIGGATAQAVILDDDAPQPARDIPTAGTPGQDVAVLDDNPTTFAADAGDDLVAADGGNDTVHGNLGADTIYGGWGDDIVRGGQGGDVLFGDDGADLTFGDLGDDLVHGGRGDDTLEGGDGSDALQGGQGNDVLRGGDGDDVLSGDKGFDILTGAPGADVFRIFPGGGADIVTDFSAAEGDRVQVMGDYTLRQAGPDVIVELQDGSLTLQQVQLSSLPSGWIFA